MRELAPIMLRTQLYAMVRERAAVDRAIDRRVRVDRSLRLFRMLATGLDDFAVVMTSDYAAVVEMVADRWERRYGAA